MRLANFGATALAVLAACVAPPAAGSGLDPVVVRVNGGSISLPDSIEAGWQRMRVLEDSLGHIVVFFRSEGTDTVALGGAEVGDSADVTLQFEPGRHFVACNRRHSDGSRHADAGEFREFVVTTAPAGSTGPTEPTAIASIEMHDFAYTGRERWSKGRQIIRVSNLGHEDHQVRLARLMEDVTMRRWLTDTSGVRLDTTVAGMARLGRGRSAYFEATVEAGRYVIYCLIPTSTGEPHIERGMFREIVVE